LIDLSTVVGFDTETTGIKPHDPETRVVSCTFIRHSNGQVQTKEWLLDPGIEIPEVTSDVHGITTEIARANGMDYKEGLQQIADIVTYSIQNGEPLVAYNASFDSTLLREEFKRVSVEFDDKLWDQAIIIDPYVMDCAIDKYRKGGHTLGVVASLYGFDLTNAHNATADVEATLVILERIYPKFMDFAKSTYGAVPESFNDLMELQSALYRTQKEGMEEYFRRTKDPNMTINKSWPFADPEEN